MIVNFDGKWGPGWLDGDGVWGDLNILPYIILGPFREIWEYVREKLCQSVGTLLAFPLLQFYGAGTV